MRERKAIDRNAMRARHFLKRSDEANSLESRLVCLYDCFVCLNGPFSAGVKAASAAGLDEKTFRAIVDSCIEDGDADSKSFAPKYDLAGLCDRLSSALETLLSSSTPN